MDFIQAAFEFELPWMSIIRYTLDKSCFVHVQVVAVSRLFNLAVIACVVGNTVVLAMPYYGASEAYNAA